MELFELNPDTLELPIIDPKTDNDTGFVLIILPPSHPDVERVRNEFQDQRLLRRGKGKVTSAFLRAQERAVAEACVVNWRFDGEATLNGEKPPFDKKLLSKLLDKSQAVYSQLLAKIVDEDAFY